ncbi:MAG: lysophospholipid acyltransferase family protein [Elusimicrobiales bacterium]
MDLLKNDFLKSQAARFCVFLIKSISSTLKIKYINKEIVDKLVNSRRIIFAFWHGRQFLLVNAHRNMNIVIMTSLSKDGDIQTSILTSLGYICIRGSSTKNAVAALRGIVRAMRSGKNAAMAVDGPRGPVYEVKEGIFFAAAMSGAIVLPVSSSAKPSKIFQTAWDKYLLPYPFSKAVIAYGKPIEIGRDDDFSILAKRLKNELDEITFLCDKEVKLM